MLPLPNVQLVDTATPQAATANIIVEGESVFAEVFAVLDPALQAPQDLAVELPVNPTDQVDLLEGGDPEVLDGATDVMVELTAIEVATPQKTMRPAPDNLEKQSTILRSKADPELQTVPNDGRSKEQHKALPVPPATTTTVAQTMVEGRFPVEPARSQPATVVAMPRENETAQVLSPQAAKADVMPPPLISNQKLTQPEAHKKLLSELSKQSIKSVMTDTLKEQSEIGDQRRLERSTDTIQPITRDAPKPGMQAMGAPLATAQLMPVPTRDSAIVMADRTDADGLLPLTSGGERTQAAMQTASAAPPTAGAETARQVANQIAIAVTGQQGRATEITLNPEELGRVRMSMSASDTSITLHLLAERPETTDLLRRHIDTLAQEFRHLGYDDISFSFQEEQDASGDDDTRNKDHKGLNVDTEHADVMRAGRDIVSDGLDLRL